MRGRPLQIQPPHSGQSHRVTVLPLSAGRRANFGVPAVSLKALSRTTTASEKALPVARWHSVQWHV